MTPPIATGVSNSNSELESVASAKKYIFNSNQFGNNVKTVSNKNNTSLTLSNRMSKTVSIGSNTTLFDTVSNEKSHANQTLLDLYKLYDLNGIQVNTGLIEQLIKPNDFCNIESSTLVNDSMSFDSTLNLNGESISKIKTTFSNETKLFDIQNEIEYIDFMEKTNNNEIQKSLKKEVENRKLKESLLHVSPKDRNNNDIDGFNISSNSSYYFCDVSKKFNSFKEHSINEVNKTGGFFKSKIKIKNDNMKSKLKSNDDLGNKSNTKINENSSLNSKQNTLSNTYYCKTDNSTIRNSILKNSFMEGENLLSLNCINPVQIFPYKLTL